MKALGWIALAIGVFGLVLMIATTQAWAAWFGAALMVFGLVGFLLYVVDPGDHPLL